LKFDFNNNQKQDFIYEANSYSGTGWYSFKIPEKEK